MKCNFLCLTIGAVVFGTIMGCGLVPEKDIVDPLLEATAGAKAVVLGDINNDGLVDVASISDESQPVQVHLRNPATLRFDTYTIAGGAPLSKAVDIELADLNMDGKLDIVVLVNDTGFVAPEGAQKEGTVVMLIQGADPSKAADWTQVPQAGCSPPKNLVLAGDDTGATDLAVGEFDASAGPDIVVLSNEGDAKRVRFFSNPGADLVTDPLSWNSSVIDQDASDLDKVEAVDLDRDGDLDLVMSVPHAKSFNLRWLQNPRIEPVGTVHDPIPTFIPDVVGPVFEATAGAKATALGDINGDGLPDIASISSESQPVQIHLRNAVTGKFDTISIAGGAPLSRSNDIALADFNADGKLDIAVLVNDTGYAPPKDWRAAKVGALVLLLQGADPRDPSSWVQVSASTACIVPSPGADCDMYFSSNDIGLVDLDVGDFDKDGRADIVVTSNEPNDPADPSIPKRFVYLFLNPGAIGQSQADAANWHRTIIDADAADFAALGVADLDSDGDLDIVATAPTGKSFNVRWLRNSNLATTWTTELVGQQEGGGNYIALGDLDGDGRIDVTAASVSASLVQWFRNPGPAALAPGAAQVPWSVYNIGSLTSGTINQVQLADLDGDAPPECLVTASGSGIGFRVNGDPRHSWEQFLIFDSEPPAEVGRLAFSDFDGDGKIDFVAPFDREGLLDDQFVLYKSIAASLWQRRLVGQQQDGADAIALGDIDEDGNIDVAAASENLEVIQWFRNPGPTSLLPTAPQVPWDVFNIGELSDVSVNGEDGSGRINQVRLVDMEGDGHLECYVTANQSNDTDGVAFLFQRQADVADVWSGSPMFTTDPAGEIGPSGFLDVDGNGLIDVIAPINRAGLNKDQIIIFER